MGRKASVDNKTLIKVLKKFSIFHPNGQLKTEGNPVWTEVLKDLDNKIEKKNLYLRVFQDRGGVRSGLEKLSHEPSEKVISDQNRIRRTKENSIKKIKDHINDAKDHTSLIEDFIRAHDENIIDSENSKDSESSKDSDNSAESFEEISNEWLQKCRRNPNPQKCEVLKFVIHLNEDLWKTIKPKNGKLPKYTWTAIIARSIWDEQKIPCAFRFFYGKVYSTLPDKYFDFEACDKKECQTYLYGVCKKKPVDDRLGVDIFIETYDTRHIPHHGKRPTYGLIRGKAMETLQYVKASKYKLDLINKHLNFGDVEGPIIPNLGTIRKIREHALIKYTGMTGPKNVIKSLLFLMDVFDSIREVCTVPFRTWYWLSQQIELWDMMCEQIDNPVLTLDATGSVTRKIVINEEPCSDVLLYQLMSTVDNQYAPLLQMLTSYHNTNVITAWLSEWASKIKILPKEIVTDGSLALLNAICLAFNGCSYKEYLNECLQHLQHIKRGFTKRRLLLHCYVRLDRAHSVKAVTRWVCLNLHTENAAMKDFYTRAIAYIILNEDFLEIEDLVLSLLIISGSPYMTEGSECDKRCDMILEKFKTLDEEMEKLFVEEKEEKGDQELLRLNNTEEETDNHMTNNLMTDYLNALEKKAEPLMDKIKTIRSTPNGFYCKKIRGNLIYTLSQFPASSAVMRKHFESNNDVASSSTNEAYFKDLFNTYGFSDILNANKFILRHNSIIEAQIKVVAACLKTRELTLKMEENRKNDLGEAISDIKEEFVEKEDIRKDCSILPAIEAMEIDLSNGVLEQNTEMKIDSTNVNVQVEHPNLQVKGKENCIVLGNSINASLDIGQLHSPIRNGNISGAVEFEGLQITFKNTCAFDSLFEIMVSLYKSNESGRLMIGNSAERIRYFHIVKGYALERLSMKEIYEERAKVLHPYIEKSNGLKLCCSVNVCILFEKLCQDTFSFKRIVKCEECGHTRKEMRRSLIALIAL